MKQQIDVSLSKINKSKKIILVFSIGQDVVRIKWPEYPDQNLSQKRNNKHVIPSSKKSAYNELTQYSNSSLW